MKNIKRFLIVFFSILFCVNSVHAQTIYHNHIKINKHFLTKKKHKSFYGFKMYNINSYNNYKNFMNIVFYGKKYLNNNIITYFTLGTHFNNHNLKMIYKKFSFQIFTSQRFGIYIKHLGIIEYSRNYNLINDINHLTHKNFYNNYYLPKKFKDNNILYQMKNSIAYRHTKKFGLIDHLTIALQYQYLDNILRHVQKNFFTHIIQYDFKKIGLSIATAYSSDIHHFLSNNNPNFKHQAYTFTIQYNLYKLYLSYIYTRSTNIDMHVSPFISSNNSKNFDFLLAYKISPKFYFNIGYLRIYKMLHTYCNYQKFFQNKKDFNNDLSIFHEINISLKYLYNKNIFLYCNHKIYFLKKNVFSLIKLNDIKSIFQIGIIYFF